MRIVLIDCDFCGQHNVPYGRAISIAHVSSDLTLTTTLRYCTRCTKIGRAYEASSTLDDAERLRLAWRLWIALNRLMTRKIMAGRPRRTPSDPSNGFADDRTSTPGR